jgi:hypothetical protein
VHRNDRKNENERSDTSTPYSLPSEPQRIHPRRLSSQRRTWRAGEV